MRHIIIDNKKLKVNLLIARLMASTASPTISHPNHPAHQLNGNNTLMNLEKKIPPPIVTLIFAILAYVSSLSGSRFTMQGQSLFSAALLIAGVAIIIIANIQFRRADTTINPLKPETASALVSNGIFGYSRNPMYLGMALALASVCLYLGSWFGFVSIPAFIQYMNRFQIIPEETAMNALFGQTYVDYCDTVRRWI